MLFHTTRTNYFSIWAIDMMAMGKLELYCSRAHPRVKTLFAQCGGLVLPSLNNMEVPTHFLDG
jgi:hypothetical protein